MEDFKFKSFSHQLTLLGIILEAVTLHKEVKPILVTLLLKARRI